MLRALGGEKESTRANGIFLKRPSEAQACGLQVLTLGLLGQVIFLGCLCCEEKYETGR